MRTTTMAAMTAALLTSTAVDAQTRYYIRERIVGLPVSAAQQPAAGTWTYGSYGSYSSSCSRAATRTRTATCTSGGKTVSDSQCTGTKDDTETTTITSGCSSLIVNGTFENGTIAPWSGGSRFGGPANYGADGSRFIIGVAPGSATSQTVSGLDAGQNYVLTFSCQDHNGGSNIAATSVGSTTGTLHCTNTWKPVSLSFKAASSSMTVSIKAGGTTFLDLDSVSIALQ